jgi:hypothetical protein
VKSTRRRPQSSEATDIRDQFQGAGYTQKTTTSGDNDEPPSPSDGVHCLHVETVHRSKLYTEDTGRFPTRARSGIQHVMVAYHSFNVILVQTFKSKKDVYRLEAYNIIIE